MKSTASNLRTHALIAAAALGLTLFGCRAVEGIDPSNPARGPGALVGNGAPVSDGNFAGGDDQVPAARDTTPPSGEGYVPCDVACQSYCDSLGLDNPINRGVCPSMWGAGLASTPIDRPEACRRLFVDMVGRFPSPSEVNTTCNRTSWGETVKELLATDEFLLVNQRRWADKLLYNNRTVNLERAYDMDDLVGKAYSGQVAWDLFASVTAAHPILTRRHDTDGDRADATFKLFMGRPPYASERSDLGRLFAHWTNGYFDHPHIGRVPDAFIQYPCVTENGAPDPESEGQCTSIKWGHNQIIMAPDLRAEDQGEQEGTMWSGYLTAEEWQELQLPGRLLTEQTAFWEFAVDEAMEQYFGYDLGTVVPEVRHEMVEYLLQYNGDIRSVHFAIATSIPYLQSTQALNPESYPWTYGPLKQIQVEPWLDSIQRTTGLQMGDCDHRISNPEDYLENDDNAEFEFGGWAFAMVKNSRWVIDDERQLVTGYRNLARTLGGCPANEVGGRFTTISILNTALQEGMMVDLCDPGVAGTDDQIPTEALLPEGMAGNTALSDEVAEQIVARQTRLFLSREPNQEELDEARLAAAACTPAPCDAESFARPVCFAVLSSAEMLFY